MRLRLLTAVMPLAFAACANGFDTFYSSKIGGKRVEDLPALIPFQGDPELVMSPNNDAERIRMVENGYRLVGISSFEAGDQGVAGAKDKAKELHAAVVLVSKNYSHTVNGSIPITTYNTSTTYSSGTYQGTYTSGNYTGTSTTTTPETTQVPYSIDRYMIFSAREPLHPRMKCGLTV